MSIVKSYAKYDNLNMKFEKCALCNMNQADVDNVLRHTGTRRILCIDCLYKIAKL